MLPPFAREIVRARDAGKHPRIVSLIFGTTWAHRAYRLSPAVMVMADDYAQGRYEFWWLAGVPVHVVNHDRDAWELWPLVLEVARVTAPVLIDDRSLNATGVFADEYAAILKWADPSLAWPKGWSDEIDADYIARERRWARAEGIPDGEPIKETA